MQISALRTSSTKELRHSHRCLGALGLDADQLLTHGIGKCLYGAPLGHIYVTTYLLGMKPGYLFGSECQKESTQRIADWWFKRWAKSRTERDDGVRKKLHPSYSCSKLVE